MPRRRPNPDTDGKPADQSPSAQPSLDEQGNPVRRKPGPKPKVDEHGNRINPPRLKTDEEVGGGPATGIRLGYTQLQERGGLCNRW